MLPPRSLFIDRLRFVLLLAVLCMLAAAAHAADVSVRAVLNRVAFSVIGDPVQLQIKVTGARDIGTPPDVTVDGLDIRFLGKSQSAVMRFENGSFTSERSTILNYQVVPGRNGSFNIPPITVEADGRSYHTEPIALTVQPSSATDDSVDTSKLSLAELVVPKKTVYLGEAIPLELRFYVDARVRYQVTAIAGNRRRGVHQAEDARAAP